MTTEYIGALEVNDGYAGDLATVHLCREHNNVVLAVHPGGFYMFRDNRVSGMDSFTFSHLLSWAANTVHVDERRTVVDLISLFISRHPVVVERGDSWPEILRLAERQD